MQIGARGDACVPATRGERGGPVVPRPPAGTGAIPSTGVGWQVGDTIVLREVLHGRVRSARPLFVLADDLDGVVGYMAPRSQVAWPRLLDGAQSQTPDQGWQLRLEQWQGPGCLFQLPAGEAFAAVLFLDADDSSPLGWKVDFLAPCVRTDIGLDTLDWALDLLAAPGLATWTVKDEDDLAQLVLMGILDDERLAQLHAARARAEAALVARSSPFAGQWAEWRPPLGARAPLTLPTGWDVVTRPAEARPPLQSSGIGSRVLDANGTAWLDLNLAGGTLLHGHAHPEVVAAVARQASLGLGSGAPSAGEARLADLLTARTPGLDRVTWTDSGDEALDLALRLARAATGRRLVATWSTHPSDADTLRLSPDAAAVQQVLEVAGADLAGVVVDGLDLLGSVEDTARASWPRLRELLARRAASGTVLVADERRTLAAGASGGLGVLGLVDRVDLVVYGASLFGGLEAGAVCGRARRMIDEATGPDGGWRRGGDVDGHIHPMLAAAALATLRAADPTALEQLGARAARVRALLSLPGFGPAIRVPQGVAADLLAEHVLVDAEGWAWLSTAMNDADEEWLLAALRPMLG